LDGGLDIPHSDKRFAGFDKDKKELDVDIHRKYVFGGHVASYMKVWWRFYLASCWVECFSSISKNNIAKLLYIFLQTLIEDEPEKYQTHFSEYIKRGIEADGLEDLYKKVHAAIRADPTFKKSEKETPKEHKR